MRRVISELEEEGLVTTSGRDFRVRDVTRIEQLARDIRRG
jgi:hypothetical protein